MSGRLNSQFYLEGNNMGDILRLETFDFKTFFASLITVVVGIMILLVAITAIVKVIGEASKWFGKPFKWVKAQNKETEKVDIIAKKYEELEVQLQKLRDDSAFQDKVIEVRMDDLSDKLKSLTDIVIADRVDRMRYEILDMASAISEQNRWYSMEQLRHTLKVYDEYEKFLNEHGMENGEVDLSIGIIQQAYQDKYKAMKNAKGA